MDGWNEDKVSEVVEVCERIEELKYELKNCVRGCYTGAYNYDELAEYVRSLANELECAGANLEGTEEDINEYDLEEA